MRRNLWTVIAIYRDGREFCRLPHPPVATEVKAKELLESLDCHGFVYYDGSMIWQRAYGKWIDRT